MASIRSPPESNAWLEARPRHDCERATASPCGVDRGAPPQRARRLKLGEVNHAGPIAASQWHLLIVGAVLSFAAGPVLLLTPIIAWHYTHLLDPYRPIASDQRALEVQAVALDRKWLFIDPDEQIATVNELDIPMRAWRGDRS